MTLTMLVVFPVAAEPLPESVTTTLVTGEAASIGGTGFGDKVPAAPLMWDDFEAGSEGSELSGWSKYSSAGRNPTYATAYAYAGSHQAGRADFTDGQSTCAAYLRNNDGWTTLYIAFHLLWDKLNGDDPGGNWKIARFAAAVPDEFHGDPKMGPTWNCNGWPWHYNAGADARDEYWAYGGDLLPQREWHRIEMGARLSSVPGVADGLAFAGFNSSFAAYDDNKVTLTAAADLPMFRTVTLTHYLSHECRCVPAICPGDHMVYYDNVYVDTTFSRVEICDSDQWDNRTHCEIQVPTAWSPSSIGIKVNQGAFADDSTAYLYVHDAADAVNSAGLAVHFAGTSTSRPGAPTQLRLIE